MHCSLSHVILIHRSGFRTSHLRYTASQRVAGPYSTDCQDAEYLVQVFVFFNVFFYSEFSYMHTITSALECSPFFLDCQDSHCGIVH